MSELNKPRPKYAVYDELCDLLGVEAAAKMSKEFGGQRIYVPNKVFAGYAVAELIGVEAAELFVLRYGGGPLYIVKPDFAERAKRDAEIIRRYDAGEKPNLLASAFKLSERRIWQIIDPRRTFQTDTRQMPLF